MINSDKTWLLPVNEEYFNVRLTVHADYEQKEFKNNDNTEYDLSNKKKLTSNGR